MDEAVNRQADAITDSTNNSLEATPSHGGSQGLVLGFLIFLASATFVFGASKVLGDVNGPFGWVAKQVASSSDGQSSDDRLKKQDTDGDGISDFDEYNVTHTSPFLKDTDGDGLDDKTEIASGHDPLCPQGQNCFRDMSLTVENGQGIMPDAISKVLGNSPGAKGIAPTLSPADLRSLLSQNGISGDILSKYSDEEIQKLYSDSLTQNLAAAKQPAPVIAPSTNAPSAVPPLTPPPATIPGALATQPAAQNKDPFSAEAIKALGIDPAKLSDPTKLTGEEVRKILGLSPDITPEVLSGYTDDQLRDLLLNSARQEYNGTQP